MGRGLVRWKWLVPNKTSPLSAGALCNYWSMSVAHDSQHPPAVSALVLLTASMAHLCEETGPTSHRKACFSLLVSVPTFMTSCICGEYADVLRAAPTWSPPLTLGLAQSSPTGPLLAGCGLCISRVISSAKRLWSGVDKIWIPYWCCYIIWRESTCTVLAQDTSLFPLTQIKPSLPLSLLILHVWHNG